jgi:histidinol dehydrogenase
LRDWSSDDDEKINNKEISMIEIYELEGLEGALREKIMRRGEADVARAKDAAKKVIDEVRSRGDDAVIEFTARFDGVGLDYLEVGEDEVKEAYGNINPTLLKAIKTAYKNIKKFHENQKPKETRVEIADGLEAGRRVVPLNRAGLYVPGGKAVYPSVMLMLAIPAKVAGVGEIIACTPPQEGGKLDVASIVAADICGVDRLFKVGGVQAIAAMAYGTETVPKVDAIAGPGGPYVSAAQRLVNDVVRLDFPPGPSEGMVLADADANPDFVAADVLSEAEHGPDSAGVLVTDSPKLAKAVQIRFKWMAEELPKTRLDYVKENCKNYSAIIVASDMDAAIEFVNEYAPEHLGIQTRSPEKIMARLTSAGTYCLGAYSPISGGNFVAGPNAILPTGGYGRMVSGVSVDSFVKKPTYEIFSKSGLRNMSEAITTLAEFEGFPAHSNSVKIRFKEKD